MFKKNIWKLIKQYKLTVKFCFSGIEITPVNGDASETSSFIADLQNRKAAGQTKTSSNKPPSKLESALDKLGLQNKRKLADGTTEDKSKKKKRLDDIMFGLGAAKGVTLEKDEPQGGVAPGQSLLKKGADSVGKIPDLNKLQDLLGRPDSPSEAKVNSSHLILETFISYSSSNTQFCVSRIFCLFTFWVFFPDKVFD